MEDINKRLEKIEQEQKKLKKTQYNMILYIAELIDLIKKIK